MPASRKQFFSARSLEQTHCSDAIGGRENLIVRTEGQRGDAGVISRQRVPRLGRFRIPQNDAAILVGCGQRFRLPPPGDGFNVCLDAEKFARSLPESLSQSITFPPSLQDASTLPDPGNATPLTRALEGFETCSDFPEATSQSRTVASRLLEARMRPSPRNARHVIPSPWPDSFFNSSRVRVLWPVVRIRTREWFRCLAPVPVFPSGLTA